MSQAGETRLQMPEHSDGGQAFFTTVGCMDGRVQEVVASFGRKKFGVKYPDTITEAGLVGKLSYEPIDQEFLSHLKFKIVDVSIGKHHAKGIVVHGHQECAGNPVSDNKHKDDIRKSVDVVKSFVGNSIPVVGVFVKRSSKDPLQWEVEEVPQTVVV